MPNEIKVKGKLISYIGQGMLTEPFGEAEIILIPPTHQELEKLKEGDVLIKGYLTPAGHTFTRDGYKVLIDTIIAILPHPKQEFCSCPIPQNYIQQDFCEVCKKTIKPLSPKPEKEFCICSNRQVKLPKCEMYGGILTQEQIDRLSCNICGKPLPPKEKECSCGNKLESDKSKETGVCAECRERIDKQINLLTKPDKETLREGVAKIIQTNTINHSKETCSKCFDIADQILIFLGKIEKKSEKKIERLEYTANPKTSEGKGFVEILDKINECVDKLNDL